MRQRLLEWRGLVRVASESLVRHRLQTSLSALGVMFGVGAVIAAMSITAGARDETIRQIDLIGLDNIIVRSRRPPPEQLAHITRPTGLRVRDVDRTRQQVPGLRDQAPLRERVAVVRGRAGDVPLTILAAPPSFAAILGLQPASGRLLSALDESSCARVCVLGADLPLPLLGDADPVGATIAVGDTTFTVVGRLAARGVADRGEGALVVRDLNRTILTPLCALAGRSATDDPWGLVDELWIRASNGAAVERVAASVDGVLRADRNGVTDYEIVVPRALLAQRFRAQRTFAVVIGVAASIALLVGGIGIMNIMLANVLERTNEIGLRRTVGATRRDIVTQFLLESVAVTLLGGVIGLIVGVGATWAVTEWAGWPARVSGGAIAGGLLSAAAAGLLFGIYPAARAARLNPIDAVRYE